MLIYVMTSVHVISTTMSGESSVYPQPGAILSGHVYPFPPSRSQPFGFYEGCNQGIVATPGDATTTIHTGHRASFNGGVLVAGTEIVSLKPGEQKDINFAFPVGFSMKIRGSDLG
jgi:hypothetical protein